MNSKKINDEDREVSTKKPFSKRRIITLSTLATIVTITGVPLKDFFHPLIKSALPYESTTVESTEKESENSSDIGQHDRENGEISSSEDLKEADNETIIESTEYDKDDGYDLVNETTQQEENLNDDKDIISIMIKNVDGTPLSNAKVSIETQMGGSIFYCYTDNSGYVDIDLKEVCSKLGEYDSYIIKSIII